MSSVHISNFISTHFSLLDTKMTNALSDASEHNDPGSFEAASPLAALAFNTATPSKGMIRLVRELVKNNTIEHAILIRTLCRAKINPDMAIQASKSFQGTLDIPGVSKLRIKDVKSLLKTYSPQRIIKLLWAVDGQFVADTFFMLDKIHRAHPDLAYLPKKPKSMTEIHDKCTATLPKVGQRNFPLEQREDVMQMDGRQLTDELVIRVPKQHFDLVDLGESLGFCIGNGDYSEQVRAKKSSIVGVFDKNGARYGIQFSRYRILEAQGFGNSRKNKPSPELLKSLQLLLTATPEMPDDFLPIIDSRWVHGYRYNDKDLYLLLNDIVYIYFNVDHDTYEGLLDSEAKGRFVNNHIKNNFEYERLGHIDTLESNIAAA
jgi:hypothetical protein